MRQPGYVMCVDNHGYLVALEIGKVYRSLGATGVPGWIGVVDETSEGYSFPSKLFVPVILPAKGKRAVSAAAAKI